MVLQGKSSQTEGCLQTLVLLILVVKSSLLQVVISSMLQEGGKAEDKRQKAWASCLSLFIKRAVIFPGALQDVSTYNSLA